MIPPDTSRPVFRVRCIKPLDHPSVRLRILERRGAAVGGGAGNRRTDPVYLKIFGRQAHAVFARISGALASERRIVGLFVGKRRSVHKMAARSPALAEREGFEPAIRSFGIGLSDRARGSDDALSWINPSRCGGEKELERRAKKAHSGSQGHVAIGPLSPASGHVQCTSACLLRAKNGRFLLDRRTHQNQNKLKCARV
jgi:hypothetical protein